MSDQNENRYGEGFGTESSGQDQNASDTQNANGYGQYEYSYTYEHPKAEPIGPAYENNGFKEASYGYQGEQHQNYTQNTGGQNYM